MNVRLLFLVLIFSLIISLVSALDESSVGLWMDFDNMSDASGHVQPVNIGGATAGDGFYHFSNTPVNTSYIYTDRTNHSIAYWINCSTQNNVFIYGVAGSTFNQYTQLDGAYDLLTTDRRGSATKSVTIADGTYNFCSGVPHLIVSTHVKGGNLNVYIDNYANSTTAGITNVALDTSPYALILGKQSSNGVPSETGFTGELLQFIIFNKTLNSSEIGELYAGNYTSVYSDYFSASPPASENGTVTISNPPNGEHINHAFGVNFTYIGGYSQAFCNLETNYTGSYAPYGSFNYAQNNTLTQFNYSLIPTNGSVNIRMNCSDTDGAWISIAQELVIDTVNPIVLDYINGTTKTSNFYPNILFSDTYINGFNFSIYGLTGETIYFVNITNSSKQLEELNNYTGLINTTYWLDGIYNYSGWVWDDHTAKVWSPDDVKKGFDSLNYIDDDTNYTIIAEDKGILNVSTICELDRCTFQFNYDKFKKSRDYTIVSNKPIYDKTSLYGFPAFTTGSNWIDLNSDNLTSYTVSFDNEYIVHINVEFDKDVKTEYYKSTGGLNFVYFEGYIMFDGVWENQSFVAREVITNNTINNFYINSSRGFSYNTTTGTAYLIVNETDTEVISIITSNYFDKTTSLTMSSGSDDETIYLYDSQLNIFVYNYSGGFVSNVTMNLTYDTQEYNYLFTGNNITLNLTNGLNYKLWVTSRPDFTTNHFTNTRNITIISSNQTENFTLFRDKSLYITFKDIISLVALNNINITLSGAADYIYPDINSSTFKYGLTTGSYSLLAAKAGYVTFLQNFNISDGSLTNISALMTSTANDVTIQVFNTYGDYVSGADIRITKQSDGSLVSTGTTDYSGQAKFSLSDLINYYVNVTASGYIDFYDTLSIIDNKYTIVMSLQDTDINLYNGLKYSFANLHTPLINNTNYNFTFNISSVYEWTITGGWFYLYNGSNLLTTNNSFTDSDSGWVVRNINTGNYGSIKAVAVIELNNTYNISVYKIYGVNNVFQGTFSLKSLLDGIGNFDKAGFTGFGRFILAIFLIVGITIGIGASTQLLVSGDGERMLILVTALTGFFSYINWLSVPLIPTPIGSQYFLFVIMVLITITNTIIKEVNK